MHGAAQRVENHEQPYDFFTKVMVGLRAKADHGHPRQEETKRTEKKEEVVYISLTWSILRALKKINKAKRLEGEAIILDLPFGFPINNIISLWVWKANEDQR